MKRARRTLSGEGTITGATTTPGSAAAWARCATRVLFELHCWPDAAALCAVQWVYSRLAGIRPTSNGFATCKIAPHISKTLGPATMSTSLATPRGAIWSNWTRHDGDSTAIVSLGVRVPLLSRGELVLPCVPPLLFLGFVSA